jgi:protein-tyrosine phosphatase
MTGVEVRVLFVCLGNICRSPTAEGVMRYLLQAESLHERVFVDSAGTGSWHVGSAPDRRARDEGERRGVEIAGTARQVGQSDFDEFDLLVAMDAENAAHLRAIAPSPEAAERVVLLRAFDPATPHGPDVPDPYFGGEDGFADVYELVESACQGLIEELRASHLER